MTARLVAWFSSLLAIVLLVILLLDSRTEQKSAVRAPLVPPVAPRSEVQPVKFTSVLPANEARELEARESSALRDRVFVATQKRIRDRAVERTFGYIFAGMTHLDPKTRKRVRELLSDKMLAASDARSAALAVGLSPETAAYAQAIQQATAEYDAQLQATLAADFSEFQRLEKMSGSMQIIENVMAINMSASDVPLSPKQRIALAAVMTDIHYSFGDPEYAKKLREPVNPVSGLSPLNEELLRRASSILTPDQLAVLKDFQSEQTLILEKGGLPPRM